MSTYVGRGDVLGAASAVSSVAGGAAAGSAAGPWGAVAGGLVGLLSSFGGGGAVDAQRAAEVTYFYNLAVAGNVAAAQLMFGSIPDVSGNEKPLWQAALNQLSNTNPAVYAAAQAAGPIRTTGQGDTATNYPAKKAIAAQWAQNYTPVRPTSSSSSSSSNGASSSYVPGATTPARTLTPMVTTAPYNWTPVLLGVGAVGLTSALFLARRPARRR